MKSNLPSILSVCPVKDADLTHFSQKCFEKRSMRGSFCSCLEQKLNKTSTFRSLSTSQFDMVAMMFKKVRSSSKTSASLDTLRRRLVSTSRNYFFSHWQQQPFWEYLIAVRDLPTIYHIIFLSVLQT